MSIEQKINGDTGTLILGEEIDLDTSPTVRENIKDLLNTTKIVVENWMTDFIEIELQVARHAKARHDKMFDGMVLKQARELY